MHGLDPWLVVLPANACLIFRMPHFLSAGVEYRRSPSIQPRPAFVSILPRYTRWRLEVDHSKDGHSVGWWLAYDGRAVHQIGAGHFCQSAGAKVWDDMVVDVSLITEIPHFTIFLYSFTLR